jgi:excisionase family DNA binding protein
VSFEETIAEVVRRVVREELAAANLGSAADEAVTLAEAAPRLKVSIRTLQRWIKSGDIHAVKIGGAVRVPVAEVLRKAG